MRPVASVGQDFQRFGSADAGDFGAEFLVRPYFDGHIQDNREVAGFFEAQADFGLAGLCAEQIAGARRRGPRPALRRSREPGSRSATAGSRARLSSGTMSCTEILGGAFSSGSTRPRTSTALSSFSDGLQALVLRGEDHRFDGAFQVLDLHRGPGLAFLGALALRRR